MVTITNTSNNQSLQIVDYLQTILSLVILLENDCEQQYTDEIHLRVLRIIHNELKSALKEISETPAN